MRKSYEELRKSYEKFHEELQESYENEIKDRINYVSQPIENNNQKKGSTNKKSSQEFSDSTFFFIGAFSMLAITTYMANKAIDDAKKSLLLQQKQLLE